MQLAPLLTAVAFALGIAPGCTEDDGMASPTKPSLDECLAPFLEELDMIPYIEGERIGDAFYLEAYRAGGQLFFSRGSYMADVEVNLTSCDGEDVCARRGDRFCSRIITGETYLGIVAVGR